MDEPDNTTIPIKRCSRGSACVHPKGPDLPVTAKFYYRDKNKADGFRAECKACNSKMLGVTPRPAYDVPDGYRRCSGGDKCLTPGGPVLPATEDYFFRDKHRQDGLHSKCKACHTNDTMRWQRDHPDRTRELARQSRLRNVEAINQKRRIQHRENPDRMRTQKSRREARKRALPATFTDADWKYAIEYFDGRCAYCGNPPSLFDRDLVLHQEHHIPVARGGAYTPNNIVPACQGCNFSKSYRDPHEWIVWRFKRKAKEVEQRLKAFFATVRQDTPASIARSHLSWSEKAAARREELKTNPPSHKRCSKKERCLHPDGPILPATHDYFSCNKNSIDGFNLYCKVCENARQKEIANRQRVNR